MDIFKGLAATKPGGMSLNMAQLARMALTRVKSDYAVPLTMGMVDNEVSHLGGFLEDGRLRILFEARWFGKYTGGRYHGSHPNISSAKWDPDLYWGGAAEYQRLTNAMALDRRAALKSASYGFPQIMGFNAAACGYVDAEEMIRDFANSSTVQIGAMLTFMETKGILRSLVDFDFERVALRYNGRGYRKNRYHIKLGSNVAQRAGAGDWCRIGGAGEKVRLLQRELRARGAPIVVDGAFGPATGQALVEFQKVERAPLPQGMLS